MIRKIIMLLVAVFFISTFFIIEQKQNPKEQPLVKEEIPVNTERKAIYISYIELEKYIKGQAVEDSKKNITKMLDNIANFGFTMVILHVKPYSDAIYPSTIFPTSHTVVAKEGDKLPYDILQFFIEEAHKRDLELHAWLNPYRISSSETTTTLSEDNPALTFLTSLDASVISGKGIYYNPASSKVTELIVDGVIEIVSQYAVDGIHFDDYFYPDDTIDMKNYEEYKKKGGTLSLSEYRLSQTTSMIKKVYDAIKKIDYTVEFGIAPEGNVSNNYHSNYIDTKKLLASDGYLDYVMPQIYFGFYNEAKPFYQVINEWNRMIKVDSIQLIPALAFYKTGTSDKWAGSGSNEWIENDNIIMRQILYSRRFDHYAGFSLFRYDYLFNEEKETTTTQGEITALKEVIFRNNEV